MKVAISFLGSPHSFVDTIKKINKSSANYIHVDIMDGKFVENKSFDKDKIKYLSINMEKKCDVHLMLKKPSKFLKYFKSDNFEIIYFHPTTEKNPIKFIKRVKKLNKKIGIVINPDENFEDFISLYPLIDFCLVMSVIPGKSGQAFIKDTPKRITALNKILKKNKCECLVTVDGGINEVSIKSLKRKKIEYVVSGSFVNTADDFESKIKMLS